MATEKELDLALAAALQSDPDFLAWFVSHTKFANAGVAFLSCRANHPWGENRGQSRLFSPLASGYRDIQ